MTKCATPGTDACAIAYLDSLAIKAYRRQLTAEEKERFTGAAGLYHTLRSQLVNNYQVTTSVEEATGNSVYGLFMTPQLLWRWELGGRPDVVVAARRLPHRRRAGVEPVVLPHRSSRPTTC